MIKIQGPKEGKTYSNIYKEKWNQYWPMGSKIYLEVRENSKTFFSSFNPFLLESFIQYPWGIELHHRTKRIKNITTIKTKMNVLNYIKRLEGKVIVTIMTKSRVIKLFGILHFFSFFV